jgi:hypothetical protein
MSQQELLKRIIQLLDARKIAYMVTGSVTSSLQGEPRSTHDIDFVIDVPAGAGDLLLGAFPESEFYVSDQAIRDAVSGRTMFNAVDLKSADKVDFWLLTDEPFDRSRFDRKQTAEVEGMRFLVSAPEDTILMKLRWAVLSGGSEKQFTDALRVYYEVQHGVLDLDYLNEWAVRLAVQSLWHQLCDEATPL